MSGRLIPAPNSVVRMTHLFEQAGFKWSEVHWCAGLNTIDAAEPKAEVVQIARAAMLAPDCNLVGTQLSVEGVNGDVEYLPGPSVPHYGRSVLGTAGATTEFPWSTILLRWRADLAAKTVTTLYHRNQFLSGVPSEELNNPPSPTLSTAYMRVLNAWKNSMISNQMGYLTYSRLGTDSPVVKIVTWEADGIGNLHITAPGHGFAVGNTVRVYNCRSLPGPSPKGQYIVYEVNGDEFTVYDTAAETPDRILNPGTCRLIKPVVIPYQDVTYVGVARRKRGTLSRPVRGRARSKKK